MIWLERTESVVVQAMPDYENVKIKEMEQFGWQLHGRQEIHEVGDAYGRSDPIKKAMWDLSEDPHSYSFTIKRKVNHYVKLHFVRSLSMPNLDKIRDLEIQYFNVPIPDFPQLNGCLLISFLLTWPFLIFWYFSTYKPKKAEAESRLRKALRQQQEIASQVKALV